MTAPGHYTHAPLPADMKLFCGKNDFLAGFHSSSSIGFEPRARRAMRASGFLLDLRAVASAAARFFHFGYLQGGIIAMAGPCFVCGSTIAPFGFGWPGFEREKPKGKRGQLWACSQHRGDAERRRENAIAAYHGRPLPHPQATTPTDQEEGSTE
jgi:hypothetical protein